MCRACFYRVNPSTFLPNLPPLVYMLSPTRTILTPPPSPIYLPFPQVVPNPDETDLSKCCERASCKNWAVRQTGGQTNEAKYCQQDGYGPLVIGSDLTKVCKRASSHRL